MRLASKQQASPTRPFVGPRATGIPKSKKKSYHAVRDGVGTTNKWAPEGQCLGRQNAPCAQVAVPGARPRWGAKRPGAGLKSPKTGPGGLPGGPQKVPLSKLMDKLNLGNVWVAFWLCLDPCGPKRCPLGPKRIHLGLECVLWAETQR